MVSGFPRASGFPKGAELPKETWIPKEIRLSIETRFCGIQHEELANEPLTIRSNTAFCRFEHTFSRSACHAAAPRKAEMKHAKLGDGGYEK